MRPSAGRAEAAAHPPRPLIYRTRTAERPFPSSCATSRRSRRNSNPKNTSTARSEATSDSDGARNTHCNGVMGKFFHRKVQES